MGRANFAHRLALVCRDTDDASQVLETGKTRRLLICLEALEYGTQPWECLPECNDVRKQAALVLGKLEPVRYDSRVYKDLLHVMKHDEDADVRDAAYNGLVSLARVRDEASPR